MTADDEFYNKAQAVSQILEQALNFHLNANEVSAGAALFGTIMLLAKVNAEALTDEALVNKDAWPFMVAHLMKVIQTAVEGQLEEVFNRVDSTSLEP